MLKQSRQQLKFQTLLAERAHVMRHNLTETEQILWRRISGKQLGIAFKRQVPVDRYILNFLAPAVKFAVEVDDRSHEFRRTADARRDRALARLGYRVLRNWCVVMSLRLSRALWPRCMSQLETSPIVVCNPMLDRCEQWANLRA